jgi:hypothetical protein
MNPGRARMAIVNQTRCPADSGKFEQHGTCVRAAVSKWLNRKWLNLPAISLALAIAGCAQNPGQDRVRNCYYASPQARRTHLLASANSPI